MHNSLHMALYSASLAGLLLILTHTQHTKTHFDICVWNHYLGKSRQYMRPHDTTFSVISKSLMLWRYVKSCDIIYMSIHCPSIILYIYHFRQFRTSFSSVTCPEPACSSRLVPSSTSGLRCEGSGFSTDFAQV